MLWFTLKCLFKLKMSGVGPGEVTQKLENLSSILGDLTGLNTSGQRCALIPIVLWPPHNNECTELNSDLPIVMNAQSCPLTSIVMSAQSCPLTSTVMSAHIVVSPPQWWVHTLSSVLHMCTLNNHVGSLKSCHFFAFFHPTAISRELWNVTNKSDRDQTSHFPSIIVKSSWDWGCKDMSVPVHVLATFQEEVDTAKIRSFPQLELFIINGVRHSHVPAWHSWSVSWIWKHQKRQSRTCESFSSLI